MRTMLKCFLLLLVFSSSLIAREYTPEEKLSQMFMIGFKGTTPQEFSDFVSGNHWGGYIFYSQDAQGKVINLSSNQQAKELLRTIKGNLTDVRIKPFMALDMDGGQMQLAIKKENDAFPYFESPQKIATAGENLRVIWASGVARTIAKLGFNVNLAPVVDVDKAPMWNSRSFSSDPNTVIENSAMFIAQHKQQSVVCALKHFPGRTSGRQKDIDEKYSREIDLKPFQALVANENIGLVMISKQTFPVRECKFNCVNGVL